VSSSSLWFVTSVFCDRFQETHFCRLNSFQLFDMKCNLICDGESKSNGTFWKKHIYCKDTETKLISLFNVIPLDFNALVPAFLKLFNSVRKKSSLVESLTNFAPVQWFLHRMKIFFLLELLSLDETYGNLTGNCFTRWIVMNQNCTFHIPKSVSIILPADGWLLNFLAAVEFGRFQAKLWALLCGS
jgi:hypothetical protein